MAITPTYVQLDAAATTAGAKMDGADIGSGVTRQVLGVGDPEVRGMIAQVIDSTPASNARGLVVRVLGNLSATEAIAADVTHPAVIAANTSDHLILAANANRIKAVITNDPNGTAGAVLSLSFGDTADGSEPVMLYPGDTWVEYNWKGTIRGKWASAAGQTRSAEWVS